jgi:hypothetical protein
MQKRKRMVVMKPSTPVAIALVMIPREATTLFIRVTKTISMKKGSSKAGRSMESINPLCVLRLFGDVARGVKAG